MKKVLIALFFSFGYMTVACQDKSPLDSLKNAMRTEKRDSVLVDKLQYISDYYRAYNFDSSVSFGQQALTLANELGYAKGTTRALEGLGLSYRGAGDIPAGLNYFFQGLQTEEVNHSPDIAELFLINIGHIYRDVEDHENAINYYRRANAIAEENKDERTSAFLLWNIGNMSKKMNHPDSALFYKQKANDRFKLFKLETGYEYMMAGDIQFELGNYPLAFDYLQKSIETSRKLETRVHEIFAYITLAEFFKKLNKTDSCIYYATKGLELAQKSSIQIKILEASRILSAQYEPYNIKEALYYRKIADSVNENLFGAKKVQSLQKIVTSEEDRHRKIEMGNIAYQNKLKQYSLMAGLLILFLIAFLLYRNNKNKQKANTLMAATLSHLKATQSQLIQSEKMASLGQLTAGIAHEIQNPLNFVNNFSEINNELIDDLKKEAIKGNHDEVIAIADDIKSNEQKINHHGKRADSIVKGMLQHSRTSTGQKELTDINALADEYLRLSYQGLRAKDKSFNATIKTDFDTSTDKINIIPQDIGRVLLNLYNNAFYAVNEKKKPLTPKGELSALSTYEPTVTVSTKNIGDKIEIRVKDNGNGIPQSIIEKIFQPFFTTKPTGQGTGLGLSLSYDIIKAHDGEIFAVSGEKVEEKESEGTTFTIQLPI